MTTRALAVARLAVFAFGACAAAPEVYAQDPARAPYLAAVAHEQLVRTAMAVHEPGPEVLTELRAAVTEYRAIVRQYPSSAYSDDALWRAGRLLLDAFDRFGQDNDKAVGLQLLRTLRATYPASRLVKAVPAQLARFEGDARLVTITSIRRAIVGDTVRITVELDAEVTFHEERIYNPTRVFVDFPGTRASADLIDRTIRFDGDVDLVRRVRIGRHPNNTTRVVLDAEGVTRYSVYPLYDPYRLVIDCVRASSNAVQLLASHQFLPDWGRQLPDATVRAAALIAEPLTPTPRPDGAEPRPAAAAGKSGGGGFTIARQLGLGVERIVIDPGHGGHDPGAKGKGITEAALVLDVALRLEKLLQKVPGTEVILTRRTDDFVPLQERTAIANREGADLFLSVHANASSVQQARGVETYFLNFAENVNAAAVAARENAASGHAMADLPDIVKAIALNNKLDESRDFAAVVQRAMIERLRPSNTNLKDLGVKQAPFVVLIGAAMPSVLTEVSFVTNTQEARLLKGGVYRQRIAEALFDAIRKYQTALKNGMKVAQQ